MPGDGKYRKLVFSSILDGIGLVTSSWVLPFIGDVTDVVWAPLSAWLMLKMYKGNTGKAAAFLSFAEELIPGTDIVPSFTLTWIYTFIIKKHIKVFR